MTIQNERSRDGPFDNLSGQLRRASAPNRRTRWEARGGVTPDAFDDRAVEPTDVTDRATESTDVATALENSPNGGSKRPLPDDATSLNPFVDRPQPRPNLRFEPGGPPPGGER